MENASVCNRPKRVRKDCSPTKLPKTVSVEQSPGDVGTIPEEKSDRRSTNVLRLFSGNLPAMFANYCNEFNQLVSLSSKTKEKHPPASKTTIQRRLNDTENKVPINSPGAVRRNLAHKKWTLAEKIVFFEGLRENGRCFDKIAKLFEQKSKNKPEINNRDTRQCRYFFTRSIKRITSFPQIKLECGIRKRYMEVLALINYGEILRKTHRELNKRTAENLNEMIHKGFSVLKLPGRVVRVKTPMCPIVKRFTKNRDVYAFVQLPQNVTFEFTPKNGHELNLMNDARLQNPFIRLTVPISKSFKSVLQFIEDRTKYRCFQNFRQLSEQCRPYVNEPSIVCSLHPYLMSNICSVEETDKVYTPPSFNGAEQMLAQGIGLEQSSASQISNFVDNLTSSSATTIERGESLEFESKIESNCDRPADNCCSPKDRTNFNIIDTVLHSNVKTNESNQSPPGLLSQNNLYLSSSQPPQSVYNSQQCVNPKSNTASHLISPPSSKGPTFQQNGNTPVSSRASEASNRPQLIYVVTAKNAPTKQYIRSATSNDSFICKLKSGFTSESVTEDLTIAGLLVMLNVCPIIQMEYSLHMETKFGAEEIGVSKELESIINLGMQISKSKRSQTPVNGNSKSPVQQSQPLTVAQQPATCNVDSNIPSTNVNPAPGSMAERQLKDHIMMLQSSGKVRLRNRLRHGQETSLGSQMISGSESSFRPITTQQQSVFCAKPLPQIAPKLFNQITGSIAVNGHGNLQKVTLGNHNNGQRVVSVNTSNLRRSFGNNLAVVQTEKQSCAQTITVTSPINFLEQNANDGQLQPGQTYMQTQQVLASSDDSSIKDIVEIALNCANAEASPKSSKECQSLNLDPLLCSTQLCSNEVDPRPPDSSTGESEVRNHDVTTGMLPPVHEILGGTGRSDNSKQHPLVSTKVSRVPEVPEINDGELSRGVARQPVPQVRFLPGYSNQMTENFVDTASNDSFLSKQLDGEIAEMLNENSIDVVNKLDALLNPTGSSGEAAIY